MIRKGKTMHGLRSLLSLMIVAAIISVASCPVSRAVAAEAPTEEAEKNAESVAPEASAQIAEPAAPVAAKADVEAKIKKADVEAKIKKADVEAKIKTETKAGTQADSKEGTKLDSKEALPSADNKPVEPAPSLTAPATASDNILALMKAQTGIKKFTALVVEDGLDRVLSDPKGKVTVFAPTDAAMNKLPPTFVDKMAQDKDMRHLFVSYHMIVGSVIQTGNLKGRQIAPFTAAGVAVSIDGLGEKVTINKVPIVLADVQAPGGMMQVLDGVLLPPMLVPMKPEDLLPPKQNENEPPLPASAFQKHEALMDVAQAKGIEAPAPQKLSLWEETVVWAKAYWKALKAKFF